MFPWLKLLKILANLWKLQNLLNFIWIPCEDLCSSFPCLFVIFLKPAGLIKHVCCWLSSFMLVYHLFIVLKCLYCCLVYLIVKPCIVLLINQIVSWGCCCRRRGGCLSTLVRFFGLQRETPSEYKWKLLEIYSLEPLQCHLLSTLWLQHDSKKDREMKCRAKTAYEYPLRGNLF